jgi:hypothetical protein
MKQMALRERIDGAIEFVTSIICAGTKPVTQFPREGVMLYAKGRVKLRWPSLFDMTGSEASIRDANAGLLHQLEC